MNVYVNLAALTLDHRVDEEAIVEMNGSKAYGEIGKLPARRTMPRYAQHV